VHVATRGSLSAALTSLVVAGALMSIGVSTSWSQSRGKSVYEGACAMCHGAGVAGAPRLGSAQDWSARLGRGAPALYRSAIEGTAKGMPPKGGRAELSDADVKAAVDHMLAAVSAAAAPSRPPAAAAPSSASAASVSATPARATASPAATSPARASAVAPAVAPPAVGTTGEAAAEVNAFNRLLKPASKRNAPPAEDGIHDPNSEGTLALQPPLASFNNLPKSAAGNRVNWVAALDQKKIAPRWDRNDPSVPPVLMDLNIVREVKGTMPDVLYPHKQHTEWLDCSNCHPSIFVPQKGANQISMASILLGQKCGVCHGKVAFPVSECRLCHSRKKDPVTGARTAATGGQANR
jgi:c(7)-type cytochrome triheme protein